MKIHHAILVVLCTLQACKKDDALRKESTVKGDDSGYLSKEEIVQEFLSVRGQYSSADAEVSTPINPETGEAFRLLPKGTFKSENGSQVVQSLADTFALDANYADEEDIDLRNWATPVKNQGSELTCTAFSTIAAMELAAKVKSGKEVNLSERHLWNRYQEGAVVSAVSAASRSAIVSEQVWPYLSRSKPDSMADGLVKINKFSDQVLDVKQIFAALKKRQPVVFGGTMPVYNSKGVVYDLNNAGDHAMVIFGAQHDSRVRGGGYFIVKNSYGPSDGDKGYIYLPFSYCAQTCWARAVEDVELYGEAVGTASSSDVKINAMIGEAVQGSDDSYQLGLSAPSEAVRMVYCTEAEASLCKAGAKGYVETTLQQTKNGIAKFKSNSALTLSPGLQIAVAAYDAKGQMIGSRLLKFERI